METDGPPAGRRTEFKKKKKKKNRNRAGCKSRQILINNERKPLPSGACDAVRGGGQVLALGTLVCQTREDI